ncbi:MAG: cysteine--tRNA ligase [Lachnospiraceae bacterium]|nr:cysteine--tRNA ligase [Lachnospiraceae bacterium]
MKIHNTLSKQKEEFVPLTPGKVSMYVCGPTVYNFIHIGNARPMVFFDTVRRYFLYRGYDVNYVSNFTDVDDKIIKRANEEGVDSAVISERYIDECRKDMASLNVMEATTHPKATEEIGGMIEMIETLIDKGFAYRAEDGTVYYRTRKFPYYGKLSHKNLDDLRSGGRSLLVTGEEQKEDPLDFVLWKPKKEGEPFWESPWCEGRPGWHIECSVMSRKYLGEQIDIHGGGEDLIFPHHENEIAQSEAASGKEFARYWMHNAFLNIDNHKMSKSAGNFFTVRDILAKFEGRVLRLFLLSAHYRSPLNFSDELMNAAKSSLERISNCAENLKYRREHTRVQEMTDEEQAALKEAGQYRAAFEKAMDDDLNTADALAAVYDLVRFINTRTSEDSSAALLQALEEELLSLTDVLGLELTAKKTEESDEDTAKIEAMIAERQAARKAKDFARADAVRDELAAMGIVLEDTREGVKWKRA